MRDVKTRAAMEQPKTRQQNAIPRTAVRILQRHYVQQKQERQTQHQRQPMEYATEQVQQGTVEGTRLTFRATRQLQRKYVLSSSLYAAVVFLLVLGPFPEDMGNTMVYHTELHNRKTRVFHRKNKGFHSFLP